MPPADLADGYNPPNMHDVSDVEPGSFFEDLPFNPGVYYISGTLYAGGFATEAMVKVMDVIVGDGPIPLQINSPDMNGDGLVNLSDAGLFIDVLWNGYDWRADFNHDSAINISDAGFMSGSLGAVFPGGYGIDPID